MLKGAERGGGEKQFISAEQKPNPAPPSSAVGRTWESLFTVSWQFISGHMTQLRSTIGPFAAVRRHDEPWTLLVHLGKL